MIYELRNYELMAGKAPAVIERFGQHSIHYFAQHGIQNIGYWTPTFGEYSNRWIYLLGYEDMADRERAWAELANDPVRQKVMEEASQEGPQTHHVTNLFLRPTEYSPDPLDPSSESGSAAVCELRIYDIVPGKAQPLHERFANVTIPLFEKHGIRNIGYWTPVIGGNSNQLWYMLGYKSLAHREEAFASFAADPKWQNAAKATTEKHGTVTEKIISQILRPAEFSPVR